FFQYIFYSKKLIFPLKKLFAPPRRRLSGGTGNPKNVTCFLKTGVNEKIFCQNFFLLKIRSCAQAVLLNRFMHPVFICLNMVFSNKLCNILAEFVISKLLSIPNHNPFVTKLQRHFKPNPYYIFIIRAII